MSDLSFLFKRSQEKEEKLNKNIKKKRNSSGSQLNGKLLRKNQ